MPIEQLHISFVFYIFLVLHMNFTLFLKTIFSGRVVEDSEMKKEKLLGNYKILYFSIRFGSAK